MVASHFLQKRFFLSPSALRPTRVALSHFGQTRATFDRRWMPADLLDDATVGVRAVAALLDVALHQTQAFDAHAVLLAIDLEDLAAIDLLRALGARHHLNRVTDFELLHDSEHLRRERDDLHELLGAELARDRPEDAGTDRLELLVDEHGLLPSNLM